VIVATGEERVVDGIRMEFQLTPGTEAPAERVLTMGNGAEG